MTNYKLHSPSTATPAGVTTCVYCNQSIRYQNGNPLSGYALVSSGSYRCGTVAYNPPKPIQYVNGVAINA